MRFDVLLSRPPRLELRQLTIYRKIREFRSTACHVTFRVLTSIPIQRRPHGLSPHGVARLPEFAGFHFVLQVCLLNLSMSAKLYPCRCSAESVRLRITTGHAPCQVPGRYPSFKIDLRTS